MGLQLSKDSDSKAVSNPLAFPITIDIPHPLNPREVQRQVHTGMTLRDYFASQIISASPIVLDTVSEEIALMTVKRAYIVADMMLQERNTKK